MNKLQYWFGFLRLSFRRFINKYIRHYALSEQGEKLVLYLFKVLQENYQPQDYSDTMLEELFNPNKLTGDDRITVAKAIFAHLVEYV